MKPPATPLGFLSSPDSPFSASALALLPPAEAAETAPPHRLDFLGRMPIPLRRPFKAGLDRTVARHRRQAGAALDCCFLAGGEWYRPFDVLGGQARTAPEALPSMLVTTLYHDLFDPALLAAYTPPAPPAPDPCHPVCAAAGLPDPLGIFRVFAAVPFVFLVDERRLAGRPAPRRWSDLLEPHWAGEGGGDIVFGGWRPNEQVPYQDYNSYLLLCLAQAFGDAGLEAFAGNVLHLQHNVRTAVQAGSNSRSVGAVSVLPWLQAELCPRRERTRVVWPEDGALAMPIAWLAKPGAEARLAPLVDYVTGPEVAAILARNCYPPTRPGTAGAFPAGARLRWPGWDWLRSHDMAAESRRAAQVFFAARTARHSPELLACS